MNLTGWVLTVHCDLYVAGITEDGGEYTAEMYNIMAENSRGNRFFHTKFWLTSKQDWHQEEGDAPCQYFTDTRKEDKTAAEALIEKMKKAGCINLDHWTIGRPGYGSEAYASNWRQYEAETEAMDQRGGA